MIRIKIQDVQILKLLLGCYIIKIQSQRLNSFCNQTLITNISNLHKRLTQTYKILYSQQTVINRKALNFMTQNNSSRNIMHQINRATSYNKALLSSSNGNEPYLKPVHNLSEYNEILISIKNAKRIINLNGTKYPIIKQVAVQKMNYQIGSDVYIFLWTDYPLSIREIRQMDQHKRINHIPEVTQITRKNKMAKNLNAMKNILPREYNFYPETWIMPSDYYRMMKKHQKGKYYIVKPENGSQGKGIYLIDNPSKLEKYSPINNINSFNNTMNNFKQPSGPNQVIQQYIPNPLLVDSLKFDLRIYALITCVSPLRIYLYQQGLARFATEEFRKPEGNNLENTYSHLTNYSINKNHSCFLVDNDNFSTGHKRLLSSLLETGIFSKETYNNLMNQIGDIIIKTIISALPSLQNAYTQCRKADPSSCFQLLGFDVILDENYKAYLLQVNQNPSLSTDTPIDQSLKSQLVKDIMQLTAGNLPFHPQQKMQVRVKNKDKYEMANLGGFQRIYPSCVDLEITEKYDNIITRSHLIYKDKFGINVVRSQTQAKKKKKKQQISVQEQTVINQAPTFYSKQKLSKIYGGKDRTSRTSQFRRRMVLY